MTTLGLKNVNLLTKEQYDTIAEPATDELYAISGSGFGFPSSNKVTLTLGASGAKYTAPANGYFSLLVIGSNADNFAVIQGASISLQGWSPIANGDIKLFYPVLKGREVTINYGLADTLNSLVFYYAEGEE